MRIAVTPTIGRHTLRTANENKLAIELKQIGALPHKAKLLAQLNARRIAPVLKIARGIDKHAATVVFRTSAQNHVVDTVVFKDLGVAHVRTDIVGVIDRPNSYALLAQFVGILGNHMNLVLLTARQHVVVIITVKMLNVAGIEVVNLAITYKGRTRIRSTRIQIGIGEQHRTVILVRHKILCRQMVPKHWTAMRSIERIVLMIDVIRITNLNQTVGVVEPAKLRLHMEQEPIGVGRDASRRLVLSSSPLLIVRACHLIFLIKHRR